MRGPRCNFGMRSKGQGFIRIAALLSLTFLVFQGSLGAQVLVEPGQRVRVTAPDLGIRNQAGRFEGFRGDTLVVAVADSTMTLPVASVTRLELSRGRESLGGKGAIVGAVVGGAIGLTIGARRVSACEEEDPTEFLTGDPGCLFFLVEPVLLSTAGGALLGGIVGEIIKADRWEEVSLDRVRVSLVPQRDGRFAFGASLSF